MMGSSTQCQLAFLVLVCSCLLIYAEPMCLTMDWEVDWDDFPPNLDDMEPFQTPGEIISGVTVTGVLEVLGLAWNAPSWQEIFGLVCVNYGPILNEVAGDDSVRRECEPILRALRQGRRIGIYDACIRASQDTGVGNFSTVPLGVVNTTDAVLNELETTENLSPIAFELLERLGPSPFSFDGHGGCSALRILLSKQIDEIITKIKNICVYPMAIVLEAFQKDGVCSDLVADPGGVRAFQVDLLNDLSDPSDLPLCPGFFASDPTHEAYVERATTIIDNIEGFLTDTTICEAILDTLDEYIGDEADSIPRSVFNQITGAELDSSISRAELCNQISSAFSPDASFVPTPYTLPAGQNLENFGFNAIPGELLPGFTFQDCLKVAGAFLRSDTLADGIVVFCDVFETFLNETYPMDATDIMTFCGSLRALDLEAVEDTCLEAIYQPPRMRENITIPSSVRMLTPYYLGAIGLEFARQLFDLTRISPEEVCLALDTFYQSDHNLQTVTRLAVDVWLAEIIPMAHRVCDDYDEFIEFFTAVRERRNGRGEEITLIERRATDFILTHTDFPSRAKLCGVISNNIDLLSGRATDVVVGRFEIEILAFLTNEDRCVASLDALLAGLELGVENVDANFRRSSGYDSTSAVCADLVEFFATELCEEDNHATSLRSHPLLFAVIIVQVILAAVAL